MSSSLEGRVAVVFGVANKRSIAWSIAQGLHQAGATVVITYQNERLELEAKDLIASLPGAARLHVRCLQMTLPSTGCSSNSKNGTASCMCWYTAWRTLPRKS